MKRAILVNGVPASGKSTVARAVTDRFGWPLLALDTIKEPFFDEIGAVDRGTLRVKPIECGSFEVGAIIATPELAAVVGRQGHAGSSRVSAVGAPETTARASRTAVW